MPNYKGHLFGALSLYIAILLIIIFYVSLKISIAQPISWLISILAGSLFPDIDTKSKGQKFFFRIICFVFIVALFTKSYYLAGSLSSFCFLPLIVNHRSILHNWLFLLLLTFTFACLLNFYFPEFKNIIIINSIFFYVGILSHLWLDLGFKRMFKLR